jgi:gamma-glutamylcyclotransferase (GGCT)/AIG2-like uncharacterized protein YtfP
LSPFPQPNDLVFVYGTLRKGGEYQWVMGKANGVLLGHGKLNTPYPLILDRYPCLLDLPGEGYRVEGEVYQIPESSGWKHLDWLEDHPNEYLRRIEMVQMKDKIIHAWTYFYLRSENLSTDLQPVERFKIANRDSTN